MTEHAGKLNGLRIFKASSVSVHSNFGRWRSYYNSSSLLPSIQLTKLLSNYILANKARFFDDRNIKVAMVEGDRLGVAFAVKAFHRTQVT